MASYKVAHPFARGTMPKKNALSRARKDIEAMRGSYGPRGYALKDISAVLRRHRRAWDLPESISTTRFIDFLTEKAVRSILELRPLKYARSTTRYIWRSPSPMRLR